MTRTLLLVVLLAGCGAEMSPAPTDELAELEGPALLEAQAAPTEEVPVEAPPPALAELPALDVNGSFESWAALNPAGCSATWMDSYTSWCSSSAPPDRWRVRSGPAWGDLLLRTWETADGLSAPGAVRHAVALRNGCESPHYYTYCRPTALEGPAVALPAGASSLRATYFVNRHPDGWGNGGTAPMATRLRLEWLGAGCVELLGSAVVPAPDLPPWWTWVPVEGTVDVPAGTACVRPVIEADVSGRGLGLDAVELVPLL